MSFIDAMLTNDVIGANGMPAHSTTGSAVLDFFASSGAMRKSDSGNIARKFSAAYAENPLLALKALFYARDVRGGQGERNVFRTAFRTLCITDPDAAIKNIANVAFYGRFDDLMATEGTMVEGHAAAFWLESLDDPKVSALAAKWIPRSGAWFGILRATAGMTASEFRKAIVSRTNVVETQMCNKEWDKINFAHVPARASMIYRKAFKKHEPIRYQQYLNSVEKGTAKINAGTLFPSDIVSKFMWGASADDQTLELQWKALPNYLENGGSILPVCDVSGSMMGEPMNVSVALGLYLSERNKGAFKDVVVTFSADPNFFHLNSARKLRDRVEEIMRAPWGMDTNLEKTFAVILDRAKFKNVPVEDMPDTILIISDMQFNACVKNKRSNALEMIRNQYESAGYTMPSVIFWNVSDRAGKPAKDNETGVGLVSGYSPSIMKSILGRKPQATPLDLMLDTLNSERYDRVVA